MIFPIPRDLIHVLVFSSCWLGGGFKFVPLLAEMIPHLTGHVFLENWVVRPPSVSTLQMTIYMQAELSETDLGLPLQ